MRNIDPKCRFCQREGAKLFLKGDRCFSPKCPIEKKGAVPPGVHGQKRRGGRLSEYGVRLREKQKLKRLYGMTEKQFKRYVAQAKKSRTETGQALFQFLEGRLDNVVYRLGFTSGRAAARQLVAHGHILVDDQKVDIPSYQVKPEQVISLRLKSLKAHPVATILKKEKIEIPAWLERKGPAGKMKRLPTRDEVGGEDINERLIVEYYSR